MVLLSLSTSSQIETMINNADQPPGMHKGSRDVWESVLDLPTLDEPIEAPPSNMATFQQGREKGVVCLHIPLSEVPKSILNGVIELSENSPRDNISATYATDGQASRKVAYGLRNTDDASQGNCWWWNVIFEEDTSTDQGRLEVLKSRYSFTEDSTSPFNIKVIFTRPCDAFRGLGHVLGTLRIPAVAAQGRASASTGLQDANVLLDSGFTVDEEAAMMARLPIKETANFETLGTMIDCSRNGVLLVSSVKFLCRKLALMGYNMFQLYTEDTYKIDGEPFFGYLRGGYTQKELKEIDNYAFTLGIEVIPCIQTLGHLGQMLQWPRFLHLRDTSEVLLADSAETYAILRKMISAATKPFRSKKVHLGMDETHGLGHGRYFTLFGQHNYKDPTRIFIDHLARVNMICLELDLQPCIWSDMLFCLNARNNSLLGYYDTPQQNVSVEGIPNNVELVYWDYYHTSQQSYANRVQSHRLLGKKSPWMAAGSWTWSRFWTALPFTFATCKASMNAAKEMNSGVKHVFLTIWGDEGNEVDLLSSLPAWSYYAEHGYEKREEVDMLKLRTSFDGICGANFDDYVMASRLDDANPQKQIIDDGIHFAPNTSKWLLWEEPALGFVSPSMQASGTDLEDHFANLANYLELRLPKSDEESFEYPLNARLRFPYLLSKALSLKSGLRYRLHLAYTSMDWPLLQVLAGPQPDSRLSLLRRTLKQTKNYHRQMWMALYAPFGWETLELRYGGLESRLETLHLRIIRFLQHVSTSSIPQHESKGKKTPKRGGDSDVMLSVSCAEDIDYEEQVTSIPELAVPLEVVYGSSEQLLDYHRVSRVTYC